MQLVPWVVLVGGIRSQFFLTALVTLLQVLQKPRVADRSYVQLLADGHVILRVDFAVPRLRMLL